MFKERSVALIAMFTAILATLSAPIPVPDTPGDDLWNPPSYRELSSFTPEPEPFGLPLTLAAEEKTPGFSLGAVGGFLKAKGADRGTWFAGANARLRLIEILAAEASITFHQSRYESGDVIVTQYPVQLTAMLYIIPVGPIRPYILGGVGWYYTRIDYKGALNANPDQTEHFFGVHLGGGAELMLTPTISLHADLRYIFVNATNEIGRAHV